MQSERNGLVGVDRPLAETFFDICPDSRRIPRIRETIDILRPTLQLFAATDCTAGQRLRRDTSRGGTAAQLAIVSPKLVKAYRDGEMTLDHLMAFTLTDDHKSQEKAWKALGGYEREDAKDGSSAIREMLTEARIDAAHDKLAAAERSRWTSMQDVEMFSTMTGDGNPLHYDAALAARSPFGAPIVQGGVTSGLLNAIVAEDLPGPGSVFLSVEWRFVKAVKVGESVEQQTPRLCRRGALDAPHGRGQASGSPWAASSLVPPASPGSRKR